MPQSEPDLTPRQRELIAAYLANTMSVAELLRYYHATRHELDTALSKGRVPFRRPASASPARNLRRRAPADLPAVYGTGDERLERRLARLLSARIAELEDRSGPGRSADPEATAKALALSVSTLATLRRAGIGRDGEDIAPDNDNETDGTPHDEPPRSLAALRDELYGHLQRIRDEQRARDGAGGPAADGAGDGGAAAPVAGLLPPEPASA